MSHAALTARYRPQTFAEVAGQETIKTILSRASLEGKVAPAYLFSGTRGVGKTTLARIFAKALNCRQAPTAEPCNQCDQCRAITLGNAVDVVEIDGASNRGIDDVRRLKEVVGYAAMEGGYKIFIIDEAHMLSREAFNALLKTLEEPPPRVTFIMATTEPHKFPATIISRCQHYVFKRLPESGLVAHLANVLQKEGVEYEENALRLIARRGAGSVRDSMSLLGQVLALGEAGLSEESARNVLGLAGQESFIKMLEAFKTGDSVSLSLLLREMLDQGLDMGFFLRELAALWRNLFMLRQSGEAALAVVELPEKEARACLATAQDFSLQHIHACWQMTLEGQRRVLTSLEPALALELLLLNIAMLPRLLPLAGLGGQGKKASPAPSSAPGNPTSGNPTSGNPSPGNPGSGHAPASGSTPPPSSGMSSGGAQAMSHAHSHVADMRGRPETPPWQEEEPGPIQQAPVQATGNMDNPPAAPKESALGRDPGQRGAPPEHADLLYNGIDDDSPHEQDIQEALEQTPPAQQQPSRSGPDTPPASVTSAPAVPSRHPAPDQSAPDQSAPGQSAPGQSAPGPKAPLPSWEDVLDLCRDKQASPRLLQLLLRAEARTDGKKLILVPQDNFSSESLRGEEVRELLRGLYTELCGWMPEVEVREPERKRRSRDDLKQEILSHPLVREVEMRLGARTIDFGQLR